MQERMNASVLLLVTASATDSLPASASDDEVAVATNRGNKLKRNARYVQEGMLTTAEGSLAHPQV
jgi:hypothetical protein